MKKYTTGGKTNPNKKVSVQTKAKGRVGGGNAKTVVKPQKRSGK